MEPLTTVTNKWTFTQKIFFRFFFIYFVLYVFPFPLNIIEWTLPLTRPLYFFESSLVEFSGKYLFHIPVHDYGNFRQRTSDFGYGYVFMLTITLIAIIGAAAWTLFASNEAKNNRLHQWLRLYIRFFLACYLFKYGFIKVFPSQFPDATASMFAQTFGDATPARLAWNFMGYSPTFMKFTGWMEVIAGLLLLLRRTTTTLGAWIAISSLSTVVMMNICYGISVKLFSIHLLAIAVFLLAGEWERVINFFILNKQVQPSPKILLIKQPLGQKILLASQIGLAAWVLYASISDGLTAEREWGHKFPIPALYGVYKTEFFIKNNDTLPPLETDSFRWKRVVIDDDDNWKQSSILFSNDSSAYFSIKADTVNKMIQIKSFRDTAVNYQLKFSKPDTSRILLKGTWKSDTIEVMMKKYDLNNYRLHRTKFKWIVD